MAEEQATQSGAAQAPKGGGKALKVVALVIILAVVIAIIVMIALFGKDLFGKPSGGGQVQPIRPLAGMIKVGTPSANATLTPGAIDIAAQQEKKEGEEAYVYCRLLNAGDKIATMGDADKYDISGPVWFAYIDEQPGTWFEHPVKYVFVDATTGQKTVYTESWPPDINSKDIFTSSQGDCPPGAALTPVSEFEAEWEFESNIAGP